MVTMMFTGDPFGGGGKLISFTGPYARESQTVTGHFGMSRESLAELRLRNVASVVKVGYNLRPGGCPTFPTVPCDGSAMTPEGRTIEQLIAEWYATGTCSEECRLEIERIAKLLAGPFARTRKQHLAQQIVDGAPGHVWEQLNARIGSDHASGRYEPTRPFRPWCAQVLRKFAVDCDRKDRGRKHTGRNACVGDEVLIQAVDDSHGEDVHAADRQGVACAMLAEFERLLPRVADRIIVAVQTGYVESLPDAVVARWCTEADVATEVAAIRSLVDAVGCLKALAEVLGLTYAVVRARSSRAMKDLRDGDFRRAREEFT